MEPRTFTEVVTVLIPQLLSTVILFLSDNTIFTWTQNRLNSPQMFAYVCMFIQ